MKNWKPPDHWLRISAIDAHTAGEPLRIITGGLPKIRGDTILERRRHFRDHYDHLRTALIWEPRGHMDQYAAVLTEPCTEDGDVGVFFLHNAGYSTMCGHAILALTKVLFQTGRQPAVEGNNIIRFDTPAGRVEASAVIRSGEVTRTSFINVPSFVHIKGSEVSVPGLGKLPFDIAFGGAFYAIVKSANCKINLKAASVETLRDLGRRIKQPIKASVTVDHPQDPELGFLYGVIIVGPAEQRGHHSRNICIFADGEIDRSPTGTGVSARAALHHAQGELAIGDAFTIESIIGTTMTVEVLKETAVGSYPAVIPRVSGSAYITGVHEFFIDPEDPLSKGFLLK
jgi:proline racemase